MRFLPEGPNIPDQLLEERDLGNVVFFCGAGVSLSANMPSFAGLTRYVVQELGTPPNAESRAMLKLHDQHGIHPAGLPAFDQIFNLLQLEYSAGEIDYLIAKRLRTKAGASLDKHQAVLRLSRSIDGTPRVVTTNFDLLFERATSKRLNWFAPPALPDLASGQPLDGLVYLHGRLNHRMRRGDGRQGFVVSSSDFGRAYLADGWATRFVRDLLNRYTVVLLGYSANDPPIRYLLQGLHSRGHSDPAEIYAFDSGEVAEVQQRWRDSGVKAIPYLSHDREHSALWNSILAWSERAKDPIGWREGVVKFAQTSPRSLSPTLRGQVASIVRTDVGAKLFASAKPPPPSEWLCVFDANLRFADIAKSFDDSVPDFDALAEYGLDDDGPRPPKSGLLTGSKGDDLLGHRQVDPQDSSRKRLAGSPNRWANPLSPRLFQLARWIASVVDQPIAVWWVVRYTTLHPRMLDLIENQIERQRNDLPEPARSIWRLLIEKFHTAPEYDFDTSWYQTLKRIEAEGWNNSVLRSFECATRPYLKSDLPLGIFRVQPPSGDWSGLDRRRIVEFEVVFPKMFGDQLKIPDLVLPKIYKILRRQLELAAELLTDIGEQHWRTKTFYPEDRPGDVYLDDASAYLHWFRAILDRLAEIQPDLITNDSILWPENEPFFFDKLRFYVWAIPGLYADDVVARNLLAISNEAFWESYIRRELLFLLKERWATLPKGSREQIEERIFNGRDRFAFEDEEEFIRHRSGISASILGWLQHNGCALSDLTLKKLDGLRNASPSWNPKWDHNAADSFDAWGGTVRTDADASAIIDLPLYDVIQATAENTRGPVGELVQYRPFKGLVIQRPARSIAVLTLASRQGSYPVDLWQTVLQNWPEDASRRLTKLFAERLARLPEKVVVDLRYSLFDWVEKHLQEIAQWDFEGALRIFDALLEKLIGAGDEATKSSIGDVSPAGDKLNSSRKTYGHAIYSPIGKLVQLLMNIMNDGKPAKASGVPVNIRMRLEKLAQSPGEGRNHAVSAITRQILWLNYVDPRWVTAKLIPWFKLDHELAEPAWNGFLHNIELPRPNLFAQIKQYFLDLVSSGFRWSWDDGHTRRLQEFLVLGCFWHQNDPAYISMAEARAAMQATDDEGRAHCLWFLARIVKDPKAWRQFGKRFLDQAWPREVQFQTEATARQFVDLVEEAGDLFPEVVDTVLPYLSPITQLDLAIHKLKKWGNESESELPVRFPDHTLALLDKIVPERADSAPYDLGAVVNMIAEARPSLRQDVRWIRLNQIALSS